MKKKKKVVPKKKLTVVKKGFSSLKELLMGTPIKEVKRKPKAKIIYESIINSKISKVTFGIITTVIGGLLLLIIWKIYEDELIEFWKNYIHK